MNTIEDILIQAPDLWRYITKEYISIRIPGNDVKHHASRWPMTEFWDAVIESGKKFGEMSGVIPLSPEIPKGEQLIQQMLGCASSAEAYSGLDVRKEFLKQIASIEYKETVEKKKYRLGHFN